jgi:hypothetical protein
VHIRRVFSIQRLAVSFYEEGCICVMGQLSAEFPHLWAENDDGAQIHDYFIFCKNPKRRFSGAGEAFFRKKR